MSDDEDSAVRVRTVLSAKELADEDTEVWLFRMPLDFDAPMLAAAGIMNVKDGAAPGTVLHVYGGGVDGHGYELLVGDPSEGQPYQVLAQQEEDGEDEEEEDDEEGGPVLRIPKEIARQFIVARRAPTTPGRRDAISDSEGEEEEEGDAPPASLPPSAVPLVIPYAPIAQVPDLRVRFLPAGAGTAKKDKGKYKRRRSEAEVNSPEAEDGGKQKKKKKEKQR